MAAVESVQSRRLDDDQIETLLQRAEDRLREKNGLVVSSKAPAKKSHTHSGLTKLRPGIDTQRPIAQAHGSKPARQVEQSSVETVRRVEDPVLAKQRQQETKKANAGSAWYNLPKTNLTPELKRDLQLLRMRNVLDPHRHYKKESSKLQAPEFSQVGTLIEGPTEFFSARLTNAQRKKSLVEEVLSGERESGRFKRKYGDIQAGKTSGKKAYYKALMAKKYKNKYKGK